ncbi:hypothetical protein Cylst_4072 [Cylindrospermum stagnale PCC 7417]|uniref:Uncharacterized protein n=1 Tax=Cylindrospermum stagnale PCC 7417 TaxID=56107 RepID=K9X0P1_9NOST|nr:hypothetical protein [Cylindrospermum stagnale]AFZ26180.1 hypothetical protein Cylst_4072 [Cylindrospermum stagnale PCC 7417]
MQRRQRLLDDIIAGIDDAYGNICTDNCFRVLYGLPTDLQLELAYFIMSRYLPIFERKHPEITVPRQIISDISKYFETFARGVNMDAVKSFTAEVSYERSCHSVLLAYSHQNDLFTVTSSCTCAIRSVINARRTNVWEADDPEAWEKSQKREYVPRERIPIFNAAGYAVFAREWEEVVKWLREKEIWNYPDEVNLELIERQLEYWIDNMYVLIVPEIAELLSQEPDDTSVDDMNDN